MHILILLVGTDYANADHSDDAVAFPIDSNKEHGFVKVGAAELRMH
jgi:hypothetical protein